MPANATSSHEGVLVATGFRVLRVDAPLLRPGNAPGELWAADDRGLHRSVDGGRSWELAVAFDPPPSNLRGLAPL